MKFIVDLKKVQTHEDLERVFTYHVLYYCNSNLTHTAHFMKITKRGLQYKMRRWESQNKSYEDWIEAMLPMLSILD
jgi:DNA-binding NtrC family response regulator